MYMYYVFKRVMCTLQPVSSEQGAKGEPGDTGRRGTPGRVGDPGQQGLPVTFPFYKLFGIIMFTCI